jgi:hypothetical protein
MSVERAVSVDSNSGRSNNWTSLNLHTLFIHGNAPEGGFSSEEAVSKIEIMMPSLVFGLAVLFLM